MAKPKCPSCSVEGIEHIVSSDSKEESRSGDPWFNIAYCDQCGHVYGVFAKYVLSYEMNLPVLPPAVG
jgi:hypothetical protein